MLAITLQIDSGLIAAVFGTLITIFTAYTSWKAREAAREAAKTKEAADDAKELARETHMLVNSQRTELVNTILKLLDTIEELRKGNPSADTPMSDAEVRAVAMKTEIIAPDAAIPPVAAAPEPGSTPPTPDSVLPISKLEDK